MDINRILVLLAQVTLILIFSNLAIGQNVSGEKKAIRVLFEAWNSGAAERVVSAFTEDVVYEDVAAGQIHRGSSEVRKWVAGAFGDIENFKLDVVHASLYKGGGTVEWIWSGTDKGFFRTGRSFSVRGVSVIEVRGGKVSRYREYYDFATLMRQLGVLPHSTDDR